jgi:hypothetical protein
MSNTHVFAIPPGATGFNSRAALRRGPRAFGEPLHKKKPAPAQPDDGTELIIVDDDDADSEDDVRPKQEAPDSDAEDSKLVALAAKLAPSGDEDEQVDEDGRQEHVLARAAARLARIPGPGPLYNAPPLRGGGGPSGGGAVLSERHASVLSSLMHSALLRGDFARARRAWALLLRGAAAGPGPGVDLRDVGSYGIGAEVLLRSSSAEKSRSRPEGEGGDEEELSEEGFEAARRFYEALIAEHSGIQHRRRNFYSALFSVWLYQIVARAKRRRRRAASTARRSGRLFAPDGSSPSDDDRSSIDSDAMDVDATDLGDALRAADDAELLDARELGERFDAALEAPQHLDNPELLRLRAHVHAWTVDLIRRKLDGMDPGNVDEDDVRQRLFDDVDDERTREQSMLARAEEMEARRLAR